MRFKRAGRRPERFPTNLRVLTVLFLPVLLGLGRSLENPAPPIPDWGYGPEGQPFWVFLSQGSWESQEFWEALEKLPFSVRVRSEWLQAVSVQGHPLSVGGLRDLPGVTLVRPVAQLPPAMEEGVFASPQGIDSVYGELEGPLTSLGVPRAHGLGFSGTGIRIGILDGTFQRGHSTLRTRPPLAERDFVDLDGSVAPEPSEPPEMASHGTALWSLISGDLPGVLRGVAPGVDVLLARVRDSGELAPADEDRWVAGLEWLESQGARIVVSGVSFRVFAESGYSIDELDGNGTPATRAADEAALRGVLLVSPVGNQGPGPMSLESPSDGDSVLAVGAVDTRGIPAAFSALGPTGDGRPKPDLYAPGTELQAASGLGDQALERVNGTEFAGALLGGAGALLVEAYPDRGPTEIVELLRSSASPDTGSVIGVPNVASAIIFPFGVDAAPVEEATGGGELTNLSPQFRWSAPTLHPQGLPITFHIELAEDSVFRVVSISDSVVGTFARRLPFALPARSRLFWRIRARSVQGIERSTPAQGPLQVPSWVRLDTFNEPGGSELVDPQPTFRWSAVPLSPPSDPLTFGLQVVSDRETEIVQEYLGIEGEEFTLPTPLPFNIPLRWRVIARSGGAADTVMSAGPFVVTSGANPPATILYQNFPNPFPDHEAGVDETRIWFDLADGTTVNLSVFDLRGRLVRRLIPGRGCSPVDLPPGVYGRDPGPSPDPCVGFSWDGRDDSGRTVAPGVYLLRLKAGGVVDVRRVVLWR